VNPLEFFRRFTERVAALVLKRPPVVIALIGVIALAGALLALRLEPENGVESITGTSSETYKATNEFAKEFGGEPIVVLIRGDLPSIVLSSDLGVLAGLEGCLAGNIPPTAQAQRSLPPICQEISRKKPFKAVYGPGTFVNTAARSVSQGIEAMAKRATRVGKDAADAARELTKRQGKPPLDQEAAAKAARDLALLDYARQALQLGQQYGLGFGVSPTIDTPAFVAQLVFDPARGSKTPKSRFAALFPNKNSAIVLVRPRADLTPAQRADAVDLVKRAVSNPKYELQKGKYLVTGAPVVLTEVQDSIQREVVVLLIGALIVMAIALMLVFPAELRLLPLALALMAAGLTYGLLKLTGSAIGVGAVAVLPILVGLAVDYAIQFHARADAAMREGEDQKSAVMSSARGAGPAVLSASLATIGALLALSLSPIPLVRGFGWLLVAGVVFALIVVLTMGMATLGWAGGAVRERPRRRPAEYVASKLKVREAFRAVTARPGRAVAIAVVLAAIGWTAGLLSPVTTDFRQLAPNGLDAVKGIETLQKTTGNSGEVDVLVKARDITDPKVIKWMQTYQQQVLADAGYKGKNARCEKSQLCPALSLTDLFSGQTLTKRNIRQLLKTVGSFSSGFVSENRKSAAMSFGIRLQSLSDQKELIDRMRGRLNPPKGVIAEVVGLSALAADAGGKLSDPLRRLAIIVLALLLVFLVVLAVVRRFRLALPPILSVALAAGISSLLLFVARIPLNPMSAALSVFIIAIAAEFTLLIYLQYLRERESSNDIEQAFRRAYRSIGPAVFASGVTAIAGFAALALSDINMLRGFALVAVVDLAVALASTVLLLPAVTIWLESRSAPEE
jgi:hydrophobe/amphiphile efflux-3 (HAE3) family protein